MIVFIMVWLGFLSVIGFWFVEYMRGMFIEFVLGKKLWFIGKVEFMLVVKKMVFCFRYWSVCESLR